eukprot:jgi/Mesvir1/12375/Mv00555-RA.1
MFARLLQRPARAAASQSQRLRGLEEFFHQGPKASQPSGRAWKACELRLKSDDDLHKLWFVLLKEKNLLATELEMCRAMGEKMPDFGRRDKVKLAMARLKHVLTERAYAQTNAQLVREKLNMINRM